MLKSPFRQKLTVRAKTILLSVEVGTLHNHACAPLLIFVGSRCAGRLRHLDRLVQDSMNNFEPLKTLTTREVLKESDPRWFVRMRRSDILKAHTVDDMLTYYVEGDAHYFVVMNQLERAQVNGRTPIVGMTPQGLELLMSRQRIRPVPFSAIVLQPADPDRFQAALMREYGLDHEEAVTETERAVRLSTLPPGSATHPSSITPVPVYGTVDDMYRIDAALRAIVSP